MSNLKKITTWAGLLHDLGKIEQKLCKEEEGKHQEIGAKIIRENNYFDKRMSKVILTHHSLREGKKLSDLSIEEKIVIASDHLSSSEREVDDVKEDKSYLISIFCRIFNKEVKDVLGVEIKERKYDKKALYDLDENFPKNNVSSEINYGKKLWENIKNIILSVKEENKEEFEKVLNSLMVYSLYIPSDSYKGKPDISIYDHLKTTSAISRILSKLYDENRITEKEIEDIIKKNKRVMDNNYFSLIVGDLSGIQNFIFDVKTKKALKQIKARSFLLDFITEVYARYLIEKLDLTIANILFCGGGRFYIISDYISEEDIKSFEKEINEKLSKLGNIYLVLGSAPFTVKELGFGTKNNLGTIFEEANRNLEKTKKYYLFDHKDLFEPKNPGSERCAICNRFCDGSITDIFEDQPKPICSVCYICSKLYDIVFKKGETKINISDLEKIFDKYIPGDISLKKLFPCKFYETDLNKDNYHCLKNGKNKNDSVNYVPVLFYPIKKEKTVTFEDLAEQSKGVKKLGILKMDVDNLGNIFKKGLTEEYSISRISSLSNHLSIFFKYWLVKEATKENLYVIYAGGDDSLIVGPWDKIIDFATKVNEKFKEYCCYNPSIHLSAGIVIADPKSTFKESVLLAESYLNSAKSNKDYENEEIFEKKEYLNPFEKNSITLFGIPFNWDLYIYLNNDIKENLEHIFNRLCINYDIDKGKRIYDGNTYLSWYCSKLKGNNNVDFYGLNELMENINIEKSSYMKLKEVLINFFKEDIKRIKNISRIIYFIRKNMKRKKEENDEKYLRRIEELEKIFDSVFSNNITNNIKKMDPLLFVLTLRIKELKNRE